MSLTAQQIAVCRAKADFYGLPQAFVLGIVEKESAGRVFWSVGGKLLPAIRPEGHYFYKYTSGINQTRAVAADLASPRANGVHVPATFSAVYAMFQRMIAIDRNAAFMSISMGVGQVMGANHKLVGFQDAESMFKHAASGLEGQLDLMLRFINANPKLRKAAQTYDYPTFARLYNGPGYRKNKYDTDLKLHTEKWQGKRAEIVSPLQGVIASLGFDKITDFQEHYGLNPDGIIGPMTANAVKEITDSVKGNFNAPIKGAGWLAGGGGLIALATDGVSRLQDVLLPFQSALATLQSYTFIGPSIVRTVALIMIAGAAGFALNYWLTTRKQKKIIAAE